jgi:hypothetical protein
VERRLPVSSRLSTILFVCLLALQQQANAADDTVLLVTSGDCPMETISALDVRKAYLGIRVNHGGHAVGAFRLKNDDKLNQIFFQSVVAMSERTYERRRLLLLLKYGQPRPREFESVSKVVTALKEAACSIAYLWQRDVDTRDGVKGIRVLWQEN